VQFAGLEEKLGEQKIIPLDEAMQKNWVDNLKDGFSGLLAFGGNKDESATPQIDLGAPKSNI